MIKIDKHNVEAYYLDYLEGKLSEDETVLLFLFIENNSEFSDLVEDSHDLLSIKLEPTKEKYGSLEDLKALPSNVADISSSNIDYWIVAKTEDTLSTSEVKIVDAYVSKNNLSESEAYVKAAYLKPNLSESFGDTSVLKKEGGTVIPLLLRITSIAAIFLFIWLVWNPSQVDEKKYASRIESNENQRDLEYLSPRKLENKTFNDINTLSSTKNSMSSKWPVAQGSKRHKVNEIKFSDFKLLNNPVEHIIVSNDFAFNNLPVLLEEDFDMSEIFDEFEQAIASRQQKVNNDLAVERESTPKYELQEQYRPVTKRLSNLTSLDMSVQKMPEASDVKQTVIQIGKFSFERKKNK